MTNVEGCKDAIWSASSVLVAEMAFLFATFSCQESFFAAIYFDVESNVGINAQTKRLTIENLCACYDFSSYDFLPRVPDAEVAMVLEAPKSHERGRPT